MGICLPYAQVSLWGQSLKLSRGVKTGWQLLYPGTTAVAGEYSSWNVRARLGFLQDAQD